MQAAVSLLQCFVSSESETVIAKNEDEELLTAPPVPNTLSLVTFCSR